MDWSPQQEDALRQVEAWRRRPEDLVFYLGGYAGTGKTTLARHFSENVRGRVLYAAYTGKAAHVLQRKGCREASTVHKLIYRPSEKSGHGLENMERELELLRNRHEVCTKSSDRFDIALKIRTLSKLIEDEKKKLAQPAFRLNEDSPVKGASLLIVDECSMIGSTIGYDLLSFGTKILVLGDPAQLPPVRDGGFFTKRNPDFMLTEIHRQAEGDPIIALATRVRNQSASLPLGTWGESRVITKKQLDPNEILETDQLLVGRNKTRHAANKRIRVRRYGQEVDWVPRSSDKIVCLRNDHDAGLLNGSLWNVNRCKNFGEGLGLQLDIDNEDNEKLSVIAHPDYFRDGEMEPVPWFMRKEAQEFDFGYALTVHKAQGSQWDHVVVLNESECFRGAQRKWLYTAITRAAKRITIVEM